VPAVPPGVAASSTILGFLTPSLISTTTPKIGARRPRTTSSLFLGIDEVDLDRGYISWRSPLANALMKASSGDRVDLRAPA
jgi:hypothetical protein